MAINLYGGKLCIENYVEAGATVTHNYNAPVYKSERDETEEMTDKDEEVSDDAEKPPRQYPEVRGENIRFFEASFFLPMREGYTQREKRELPVEELLHRIYEVTEDWTPGASSVHKWKILYEYLRRQKYFAVFVKPRYSDYVDAVVRYCFPDVAGSFNNNISHSRLAETYSEWSSEDKTLYQMLKERLNMALTSS